MKLKKNKSNKKLVVIGATLLVTGALLVVTRFATRNKCNPRFLNPQDQDEAIHQKMAGIRALSESLFVKSLCFERIWGSCLFGEKTIKVRINDV